MTKYRITYRTEVVIDVPDGVDLGPLDEERKINDYDLRTEPKLIREFNPTDPVIHLTGKIETFEGWYTVSSDTPTDAAPGEADDYPGTPLARLDEAVLGREALAVCEAVANLWSDSAGPDRNELIAVMKRAQDVVDRARALRDSDG